MSIYIYVCTYILQFVLKVHAIPFISIYLPYNRLFMGQNSVVIEETYLFSICK